MTGKLFLVSIGPGFADHMTPHAACALEESEAIVGYELYLDWIKPWLDGKTIYSMPLTQEHERAIKAIDLARSGGTVSLISSGDIGVYAMAAIVFEELHESESFELQVIPGITAATASASLLGAPLANDFAILSLSDLMCPWPLIEERARHVAEADLCLALYNVQSNARKEGIYKILRILLEHKSPDTLCGVVRNAYRHDQSVSITTLAELLDRTFDMFTTITVGNSQTRRKGAFIYTKRTVDNGQHLTEFTGVNDLPREAVWVFSGTSDGNELANQIVRLGHKVVLSAATEYGADTARISCPGVHIFTGLPGYEARRHYIEASSAKAIVDATHPYATLISQQLIELGRQTRIPYVRYERSSRLDTTEIELCDTIEEASARAAQLGKRIFLATGSKDLSVFLNTSSTKDTLWFARVTPDARSIDQAVAAGIPRSRICAMQGPFSQAFNESLWREWEIDCVVTKDSGTAGGYDAKIKAARTLGIPVLVVARPSLNYPVVVSDFDSVVKHLSPERVHA